MAVKNKVYNIELTTNAPKTIAEMNEQLKVLNSEIEKVEVGSQAFNDLAASIQETEAALDNAGKQVKGIDDSFKSLNPEQKTKAFGDLSAGIIGGFSLASQTVGLFSSSAGKSFEKITQSAVGYIQAIQSIQAIGKGLSGDSLKLFQSITGGFKQALNSAKAFSAGTKAALAATGIGLVVIALGLVIANWEKLVALVSGSSLEDDIKKTGQAIEKNNATIKDTNTAYDIQIQKAKLLRAEENAIFNLRKKNLQETEKLLKDNVEKAQKDVNRAQEELNDDIALSLLTWGLFGGVTEENTAKLKETNKTLKEQEDQLQANVNAQELLTLEVKATNEAQDAEERQNNLNREIALLQAIGNKDREIYEKRRDYIKNEIKDLDNRIKKGETLNFLDEQRLKNLQNEAKILNEGEKNRQLQERAKQRELELQRVINEGTVGTVNLLDKILKLKEDLNKADLTQTQFEEKKIELLTTTDALLKTQYENELKANLKRSQDLIEYNNDLRASGKLTEELNAKINKESGDLLIERSNIAIKQAELEADIREREIKKYVDEFKKGLNAVDEELKKKNENPIKLIDADTVAAEIGNVNNLIKKFYEDTSKFSEAQLTQVFGDPPFKFVQDSVEGFINNVNGIVREKLLSPELVGTSFYNKFGEQVTDLFIDSQGDIVKAVRSTSEGLEGVIIGFEKYNAAAEGATVGITVQDTKVLRLGESYRKLAQEIRNARKDALLSGDAYEQLISDIEQYAQLGIEAIDGVVGIFSGNRDEAIQESEKNIEKITEELDMLDERLDEQYDKRKELEKLLEEASGERRDAIQAEMDANDVRIAQELANQKKLEDAKKAEEERIKSEKRKQARLQKAADVTQSIISGLIAVTKALPNIPLSVATGIAAAANTAAIIAQPIPQFAGGGFIGEGITPAVGGVDSTGERKSHVVQLHESEYVTPRRVVEMPEAQPYLSALETMRKKSMAAGGSVSGKAPSVLSGKDNMIEMMKNSKFVVSVVEFDNVKSRLVQSKEAASI